MSALIPLPASVTLNEVLMLDAGVINKVIDTDAMRKKAFQGLVDAVSEALPNLENREHQVIAQALLKRMARDATDWFLTYDNWRASR